MTHPSSSEKVIPGKMERSGPSGVVVPHTPNKVQRAAASLIAVLERLLSWSIRYQLRDRSGLFEWNLAPEPVIFCVWHNRLAVSMAIHRKFIRGRQPSRRLAAMVSASKDGALLSQVLRNFGVEPVRGSSSRRGRQALLELTSWAEKGYDLAITPDGPRGPRYIIQDGILALAQVTGAPIVPVGARMSWKVRARSWDQFQIPLPGSSCEVFLGEVIRVPRTLSDSERSKLKGELQCRMQEMTHD